MAKKTVLVNNEEFAPYITGKKIHDRISQLGKKISKEYRDKTPIFIGILNGSFVFFADLMREITIECEVDFLKLSSYGDAKISSGNVHLLKDLNCQVMDRDIIIVEDIIDSGLSIDFIKRLILAQNPKSFAVVSLLYKTKAVKIDFAIDYIGFKIPNDFVVGYGLDYAQKGRNLPAVYKIVDKKK
ncbi:MAG: hypoxanthine phosphoribosyltransferase [Bacteroidota bacterium]|nr:hypoxanthine phosphoribosyltransferase [Bacteroidota bacterium]